MGFELAGFETHWFAETDKWCNKILEKQWPEVPRYGDVNELSELPTVDVLIGGFPCQPVSQAGKKKAQEDSRWLWPGFNRAIGLLEPRYIVVENVPGLRKRGFDIVLGDLAERGYDAEWFSLKSSDIGAPHRRERVFIIAHSPIRREHETDEDHKFFQFFGSEDFVITNSNEEQLHRLVEQGKGRWLKSPDGSTPYSSRSGTRWNAGTISREEESGWSQENEIHSFEPCSALTSYPSSEGSQGTESERGRNLSSGRANAHAYSRRRKGEWQSDPKWQDECGDDFDRLAGEEQDWGKYEEGIRRWESIFEPAPKPLTDAGRLSPNFVEWMMGYPQDWTEGVSRSQRLKMLGNSVQVQSAYEVANIVKALAEFS